MHLGLLLYGTLEQCSGGFLYDRRLVDYLCRQSERVTVISLGWPPYARGLGRNFSAALYARLKKTQVDLWLQDELAHPSLFLLNRFLHRCASAPRVAIVHHLRCAEPWPPWQTRLYRQVERLYLGAVDACICNSSSTQAMVQALMGPAKPTLVAVPGGDNFPHRPSAREIDARARSGTPFTIIFVGNLIPRKGLHTLIAALTRLPRPDWRLSVVGNPALDPSYLARLRKQIAAAKLTGAVDFLGPLPAAALAECLANSHVLAVPSSFEGYGIVYLEAMSFGLPPIATTAGGAGEIITDGHDGFLVPPGDAAALAHRLALLMSDRSRLAAMSQAARARFAVHPTWEDTGGRIHAFLKHLIR